MSTPAITLPAQFEGLTLSKVVADLVSHAQQGWPEQLIFDFSKLRFVKPCGVVFLSNLIHWLHEKGTTVSLSDVRTSSEAVVYLDDSLFFEQHCGQKLRVAARPRATTQPLKRIAQRDSHDWLESTLLPWLADRLKITQASLYMLKACCSELFNNIQDHTRYDIGSIFVQHFPANKQVIVAISDMGIGIPEKVREKLPELNDTDAIIQATQEGFTTKSRPNNAGVGLNYLLRTVVTANGGAVTFYSRKGVVQFYKDGTEIKPSVFGDVGYCPGTTIEIILRTDTIENVPNETEDLLW